MPDQYFYIDAANETVDPLSWEVLGQLHGDGVVKDDTLVAAELVEDWAV